MPKRASPPRRRHTLAHRRGLPRRGRERGLRVGGPEDLFVGRQRGWATGGEGAGTATDGERRRLHTRRGAG